MVSRVERSASVNEFKKLPLLNTRPIVSVLDWFTPSDGRTLNRVDGDLGSTRAMLLAFTSLVIGGRKDGVLWVLNGATGRMVRLTYLAMRLCAVGSGLL